MVKNSLNNLFRSFLESDTLSCHNVTTNILIYPEYLIRIASDFSVARPGLGSLGSAVLVEKI